MEQLRRVDGLNAVGGAIPITTFWDGFDRGCLQIDHVMFKGKTMYVNRSVYFWLLGQRDLGLYNVLDNKESWSH